MDVLLFCHAEKSNFDPLAPGHRYVTVEMPITEPPPRPDPGVGDSRNCLGCLAFKHCTGQG